MSDDPVVPAPDTGVIVYGLCRATRKRAKGPRAGTVVSSNGSSAVNGSRTGLLSGTVAGVIVVESLYVLWSASRGFFFQDDFVDLALVKQLGFNGRMLEQPIFGHFIPGYNAVNYLVVSRTPYQWPMIEAADVLLFALSLFLLHRLLMTLFGPTWIGVVLVALAGASFSFIPSIIWWASGLEQLVAIPAVLLAILCHVRYLSSGRLRHALYGSLALAIGLAFYDGTLVGALFIVLMTVLFWPMRPGLRGILRTLFAHWRAWLCYAVPIALDLGWRFTHNSLYATPPLPSPGQALQFISLSWTQTFVPLMFGLDAWSLPSHLERFMAGAIGQVALVVFVVWTIHRRSTAGRAWVLFGVTFVATTCLVGLTRVSLFGPGDASDVRYVTLGVYLFVISFGLALLPLRNRSVASASVAEPVGASEPTSSPGHAEPARRRLTTWIIVVPALCAVLVGYGALLVFDQSRDFVVQDDHAARQFLGIRRVLASSRLDASLPVGHRSGPCGGLTGLLPIRHRGVHGREAPPGGALRCLGAAGLRCLRSDGSVVRALPTTRATGVLPLCRGLHGHCGHADERRGSSEPCDPSSAVVRRDLIPERHGRRVCRVRGRNGPFPQGQRNALDQLPPRCPLLGRVGGAEPSTPVHHGIQDCHPRNQLGNTEQESVHSENRQRSGRAAPEEQKNQMDDDSTSSVVATEIPESRRDRRTS